MDKALIIYTIFCAVVATPGYFMLLKKCNIPRWRAFIPLYRTYEIARVAGSEDAGIAWMLAYILVRLLRIFDDRFAAGETLGQRVMLVLFVVASIVYVVYEIKILYKICDFFCEKRSWVIAWFLVDFVTANIWGFDPKHQPGDNEETEAEAIAESGRIAEAMETGLTVNINARTVRDGMKTRTLIRDIHMNIEPGKMVLLLGGSGAGKTTFINALIGYEPADAQILLNGSDIYKEYGSMKYEIGMVPQMDLMRYEDTVYNTLMDAATLRLPEEIARHDRKARVLEALEIFGLSTVKSSLVGKLSGGQKKRLSIAMEFICDPKLFVLDEPDSGLDGILARDLMERLHKISREGRIVIVITHTPDRVIDLFDEVIVLAKDAEKSGRLVFHGPIDSAKEFFGKDDMESIVKSINRIDEGGEGRADEFIEKFGKESHE